MVTLLLTACAASSTDPRESIAPYAAPAGGDTARLVMRGFVPAGDIYLVKVLSDGDHCSGPTLVGTGNAVQHPVSTTLQAGQPTTLEYQMLKASNRACTLRWTVTPTAGKTYLLTGISLPSGCRATVSDMTDADHIKQEPALRRNPAGGRTCLPIADSKPGAVALAASAAASGASAAADAELREGATSNDLEGLITP